MPVDGVMVMVREKYGVKLAPEERERLEGLVRSGKSPARVMARARILLKTGEGWKAPKVAEALDVSEGTVYRSKQRFAGEGLERALRDRRQANRHRKLDDRGEAHLVAPRSWPEAGFGLQPSAGGARPLDPATPGREGGGVGVGVLHVP
jgi:hypothetical protein